MIHGFLSRRVVLRGLVGMPLAGRLTSSELAACAQSTEATAVAPGTGSASALPPGIRVVDSTALPMARPRRGGSVQVIRPGTNSDNFNPAAFAQDPQVALSYLEPLVRPDPATLRPRPWLAERWEWRGNGLELVLTVRGGIVWQDGSPFSAADAVFSFQVYQGDEDSAVRGLFSVVDSIETPSNREVLVRFRTRDANWLFNAATLPIFSRRQYEETWRASSGGGRTLSLFDWQGEKPIGTGPWQLSEWDRDGVTFEPFNRYWRAGPWLDRMEIAFESGEMKRLDRWVSSKAAITWPVRLQPLADFARAEGRLYVAPAASVMFGAFNFANPLQPAGSLWTDVRVRRAASMAIDRERYASEVFAGFIQWDVAGTVAQPWAHDGDLVAPAYNPEAASVLLAEAGWLDYDGDGVREDVNGWQLRPVAIVSQDSRPELSSVLARVARDLAVVGMALTVETLPAEEFQERWISRRDYDLIAYAYDLLPGFTDFDLYGSAWDIRNNPAGWNPGGYANADVDAAIDEFLASVSIERQAAALNRLQHAADDELFGLWFGFPNDLVLASNGIEGFTADMAWQTARTSDLWTAT